MSSSRKRPHEATKPATPTNGLHHEMEDIEIHSNGSNNGTDNGHSNGDNFSDRYSLKYTSNRPVSK